MNPSDANALLPVYAPLYKSVAVALLFSVFLGPIGLLYATFCGGVIMIVLGIVVISSQYFFPIVLLWLASAIWGVRATEKHNNKISKLMLATMTDRALNRLHADFVVNKGAI